MTIATFTTTMGNQEGVDNLNGRFDKDIGHDHSGSDMNGGLISYNDLKDKPTTIATADKLSTPRTINGVAFDGSADIAIDVSAVSAMVGTVDNIVNGMGVTVGTGLQAVVGTGRAIIDETVVAFTDPLTITLEPRMASLVYAKADGSVAKVYAQFPTVSTQKLRYILDGSPTIVSTGSVTNIATKTGAVNATDGRIGYSGKGDGTTGYYTCARTAGVPAYSSASTRILVIDNFVSNGAIQIFHNDGISKFGCTATNNFTVNGVDTLFTLENGGAYVIALPADVSTTSASVYVNGVNVATGAYITNATAVAPTFYSGDSGASKSPSQLAYFEYYATKLTPAQIAQISNNLLLPCSYDDVDIRSILPANSISLGYVKTNSVGVIELDSNSYKYGIRQGATGGNRIADREWKYVTSNINKYFDNPFGTANVSVSEIWYKKNLSDDKHSVIDGVFADGQHLGCYAKDVNPLKIQIATGSYLIVSLNSYTLVNESSGYIAVIAEVIE